VAEGKQRQDARAPRQGLRHSGQQAEIGGTGQDETPRSRPGIDLFLEVRQQGRCPLHLVDDGIAGFRLIVNPIYSQPGDGRDSLTGATREVRRP
jgi:hypothetical protein